MNSGRFNRALFIVSIGFLMLAVPATSAAFNDSGWVVQYQEDFDSNYVAGHGQRFGQDDWLIYQLMNGGTVYVVQMSLCMTKVTKSMLGDKRKGKSI